MSTGDAMTTTAPRDTAAFDGNRPKYSGDWREEESAGIVPVPLANRYGTAGRMFPVWVGPNMGISAVFIGTVGVLLLCLSFGQTEIALILGVVIGAMPVAALCTMGPRTGTGQLPFARLPFGRGAILPGTFQWASAVGWVAIGCLFGAQAAHLLFHVPFWAGALIVVAATMAISIRGYEAAVLAQITGTVVMPILFAILTWRIFSSHHIVLAHATVHGGAATGAFILMVTVAASGSFSWASYAADYSRYLPGNTSSRRVFWYSLAGLLVAFTWLGSIGAAASSVLGDQTAAGIRNLMGGGALGELALIAIVFAAIISSVMNDYSGSLALQTVEIRVKRPYLSAIGGLLAFGLIMWVNAGNTSGRLTNILLLTAYWCAPFAAIVGVDWWWRRRPARPDRGDRQGHRPGRAGLNPGRDGLAQPAVRVAAGGCACARLRGDGPVHEYVLRLWCRGQGNERGGHQLHRGRRNRGSPLRGAAAAGPAAVWYARPLAGGGPPGAGRNCVNDR